MLTALRLLLFGVAPDAVLSHAFEASPFGPFAVSTAVDEVVAPPAGAPPEHDAVLLGAERVATAPALVERLAATTAVLVVSADADPVVTLGWLQRGAQDVLDPAALSAPDFARRVRAAIERQRVVLASRKAYATDLATGLPHRQQFVEHMSQLLAL